MPRVLDQETVAGVLPGEWIVGATNVIEWLDDSRRDVIFRFEVVNASPLTIREHQSFTTREGKERQQSIQSEWVNGVFRSKGRGILRADATRWRLGGVSEDHSTLVLRVATVRGGQDGLIVLVRRDAVPDELRIMIATKSESFGVGPEDFASLSWLELPASAAS